MFENILYGDIERPCLRLFSTVSISKEICTFVFLKFALNVRPKQAVKSTGVRMFVDERLGPRKSEMLQVMTSNLRDEG